MLVDRRTDDDHDVFGIGHHVRVVTRLEASGREHPLEQLAGAGLEERHLRRPHLVDGRRIPVVAHHRAARLGEREPERQANVTPAADDDDILDEFLHGSSGRLASPVIDSTGCRFLNSSRVPPKPVCGTG